MIKKTSLLMVFVLLSISLLAGCQTDDKPNKKKDVTITIFQSKVEISEQLEELAKEYSDMTDGVKVEVWGTTGDDFYTQLQAKLTAGQGPTILSAGVGTEVENIGDYLYDLSNQDYIQYIAPGMEIRYNDKVVGIPYGAEGFGLVYNADLVSPSDVTDLSSFENTVKDIKGQGVQPISLSSESYFLIAHILNVPFALQADPQGFIAGLTDGTSKMSDDSIFKEWAAFMEVIRSEGTSALEVTYDIQTGDFATGKTAMIHQGNWCYGMFKDYDVTFDMGILPLPVKGNDKISVGIPNSWAINNQASEDEINAALDFFNWLFTSEKGHSYIVDKFGFIPAMTNIKTTTLDPLGKAVAEYTANGKTLPWMFGYWPASIVNNDFLPATQKFFIDESMTGEQFLAELDKAWENASK